MTSGNPQERKAAEPEPYIPPHKRPEAEEPVVETGDVEPVEEAPVEEVENRVDGADDVSSDVADVVDDDAEAKPEPVGGSERVNRIHESQRG